MMKAMNETKDDSVAKTIYHRIVEWLFSHKICLAFVLMMLTSAVLHISITFIKMLVTFDLSYFSMWLVLGLQYVITPPSDRFIEFISGLGIVVVLWLVWYVILRKND